MAPYRTSKSHVTAWALAVVAVPVLYLLSVPVVLHIAPPDPFATPGWQKTYAAPHTWLLDNTALAPILQKFDFWYLGHGHVAS